MIEYSYTVLKAKSTDISNNMDKSHKRNVEQKKLDMKEYILCTFIYKSQKYATLADRARSQDSVYPCGALAEGA